MANFFTILMHYFHSNKRESMAWQEDTSKLQRFFIQQKLSCVQLSAVLSEGSSTLRLVRDSGILKTDEYEERATFVTLSCCTPAGARTLDTLIKSQVLYQLSYGCIVFSIAGAKVRRFFGCSKYFRHFF